MTATTRYPVELRERAVRLYRELDSKPVSAQPSHQLNVHLEALRNWIRQDPADHGERDDRPTSDMLAVNRRLRVEKRTGWRAWCRRAAHPAAARGANGQFEGILGRNAGAVVYMSGWAP